MDTDYTSEPVKNVRNLKKIREKFLGAGFIAGRELCLAPGITGIGLADLRAPVEIRGALAADIVVLHSRLARPGRKLDIHVIESCNNTARNRKADHDEDEPGKRIIVNC